MKHLTIQYIFIACPNSWVNLQGSCYKISSKALNWTSAKSACEALGSDLVVINSHTELQALTSKVSKTTWIGLHRDSKDKSRWLWVDGSRPTYAHWNSGEPNGLHEECAQMYSKVHEWKWNDGLCSHSYPYICETRGECRTNRQRNSSRVVGSLLVNVDCTVIRILITSTGRVNGVLIPRFLCLNRNEAKWFVSPISSERDQDKKNNYKTTCRIEQG